MARTGNHGRVIARDKALLWRMYWVDEMTLPQMGEHFGVTHKSVHRTMKLLGIPTRSRGRKPERGCLVCGAAVKKIRHAGNGAMYGRLCVEHWKDHRNALARDYIARRPDVRAKRKQHMERWYIIGPKHPQGEQQWLVKGKHLLRTARRILNNSEPNRAVSRYRKAVSAAEASSRTSCPASSVTSWPVA